MRVKVQVVTTSDDGQESIRELACIEREDLTAESLGLSVAESKTLLQSLQKIGEKRGQIYFSMSPFIGEHVAWQVNHDLPYAFQTRCHQLCLETPGSFCRILRTTVSNGGITGTSSLPKMPIRPMISKPSRHGKYSTG